MESPAVITSNARSRVDPEDRPRVTSQMIFDHLVSEPVSNAAGALACLRRRPTPADVIRFAGLFEARVEPVLALYGYLGSPYDTAKRRVYADVTTPVAALKPRDIEAFAGLAIWRGISDDPFRAHFVSLESELDTQAPAARSRQA
jgi:hypothetical protein